MWQVSKKSKQLKFYFLKLHYRIEESEKISKDSVGIGMGLSVCKEITKKLGPEGLNLMYVDSAKNMGSSFKFFLKEFNDDRFSIVLLSDK
jgi:signal transduction histidine kinase